MAAVNIETRSSYGELVKGVGVQFLDVFNQSLNSYSLAINEMYAQPGNKATSLAKQLTTDKATEHFLQKTGTSYPSVTAEGSAFASDSRLISYKTSVSPQLFSNSVSVSYQAIQDRDYKQALDEFGDLTVGMKEMMDKTFFDMFNLAFTAQSSLPSHIYGFGDGKPMASTIHPRKDGGTAQSNVVTSGSTKNLPLTDDNLELARIQLTRQLDDRGKPTRVGGGKLILVVPPELTKTALIITKAPNDGKRSGTANHDINIYDGYITVIESKYVAQTGNPGSLPTTSWFLIDPVAAKLIFLLREGMKTHTFTDPNTLAKSFYIIARWALTWTDWRGIVCSKGDSSAYTS